MIDKYLFETYGRTVNYKDGTDDPISFKAFIQPLRYKNKMYLRGEKTDLGKDKESTYLYIGPPEVDISRANAYTKLLYIDDIVFIVDREECVYIGDKVVYRWAILRPSSTEVPA